MLWPPPDAAAPQLPAAVPAAHGPMLPAAEAGMAYRAQAAAAAAPAAPPRAATAAAAALSALEDQAGLRHSAAHGTAVPAHASVAAFSALPGRSSSPGGTALPDPAVAQQHRHGSWPGALPPRVAGAAPSLQAHAQGAEMHGDDDPLHGFLLGSDAAGLLGPELETGLDGPDDLDLNFMHTLLEDEHDSC